MYFPYKNGTNSTVGYDGLEYKIHYPEKGYVWNRFTGAYERVHILFSEQKKERQKWQRTDLPVDWKIRRREEKKKQKVNLEFVDPELERFRVQEWGRRMNGVWMSIKGEVIYITGENYMYLNWWETDFGYPEFRMIDVITYWFTEWSTENPYSFGINMYGPRRMGKSAKGGLFISNDATCNKRHYAGFQSKESTDAKDNFHKYVRDPFLRLVDFFRPQWNTSNKLTEKIEIRIPFDSSKDSEDYEEYNDGLNSWISFKSGQENAYDYAKLHRYWRDEGGKLEESDVYRGWLRTKPTMMDTGTKRIIGKAYFCTTIEELKSGNVNSFIKFLADSDPKKSLDGNTTVTGLFEFFVPAQFAMQVDEFGFPMVEENLKTITDELKKLSDTAAKNEYLRKFPRTREEARKVAKGSNPYNQDILVKAETDINKAFPEPFQVGNFEWETKDQKVRFSPDTSNGRWHFIQEGFLPTEANKVNVFGYGEDKYKPENYHKIFMGADPVKDAKNATSKRKSSFAASVYRKDDSNNEFSRAFIADYLGRLGNPELMYEDIIMACFYFGCKVKIEKQDSSHMVSYFTNRGYDAFVDTQSGIPGDKNVNVDRLLPNSTNVTSYGVGLWKVFISNYGHRLKLRRTVEHLIYYSPEKHSEFDLHVSGYYALIQSELVQEVKIPDFDMKLAWETAFNIN